MPSLCCAAGDLPAASLRELTLDCSPDANERAPRCLRLRALTELTRLTLRGHGSHRLITYEETPKVLLACQSVYSSARAR
jgi:hypothetical protein